MRRQNGRVAACLSLLLLVIAGCTEGPPKGPPGKEATLRLERADFAALEGWSEDDQGPALDAFRRSCRRITGLPDERAMGRTVGGTARDWKAACTAAAAAAAERDPRAFFEHQFVPYAVRAGDKADGLFTG